MNKYLAPVIIAAISSGIATPAMAQEDMKTLSPAGDWTVTPSSNNCSLRRTFGNGKNEVELKIDIRQNFFAQNVQLTGATIPRLPKKWCEDRNQS